MTDRASDAPAGGALILAAGFGRRFGGDKRRARLADGTPLLDATLERYREAFDVVRVVLRAGEDALAAELARAHPGIGIVSAARAADGMGRSLAEGAAACGDWDYLFVALGDMPFVRATTLRALDAAMRERCRAGDRACVVQPVHHGEPGHPVGFGGTLIAELTRLEGDEGARRIARAAAARHRVDVDDAGVLRDVDTPQALYE